MNTVKEKTELYTSNGWMNCMACEKVKRLRLKNQQVEYIQFGI